MTTSFPYMKIAKEFDLPYEVVLLYADALRLYGGDYWRAWAVDELTHLLPDEKHFEHFARAMNRAWKAREGIVESLSLSEFAQWVKGKPN